MIKPQLFNVWVKAHHGSFKLGQTAFEHVELEGIWDMWEDEMYKEGEPHEFFAYFDVGGIRLILTVPEGPYTPTLEPLYHNNIWLVATDDELDPARFHSIHHYIKEHTNAQAA